MTTAHAPRHCAAREPREPLAARITRWSYSPLLIWICHPQLLMPWCEWAWVRRLRREPPSRRAARAAAPAQAVDEPRADWVVTRFREDWERLRVEEALPLPPLRRCCLATVDEPHTPACGSASPVIIPAGRHAAALPRRKPIAGRQPWQTAQLPVFGQACQLVVEDAHGVADPGPAERMTA